MVHTIARKDLTNITLRGRETSKSTYVWFHLYKIQKIRLMVMKIGIMSHAIIGTCLAVSSGTISAVLPILFLRQMPVVTGVLPICAFPLKQILTQRMNFTNLAQVQCFAQLCYCSFSGITFLSKLYLRVKSMPDRKSKLF